MKKLGICLWLFLFSHLVVAADVFDGTKPRDFKLADPLELNATVGGYPIWNGEGKWRLYDIKRRDSTGSSHTVPIGDVGLFQICLSGRHRLKVQSMEESVHVGLRTANLELSAPSPGELAKVGGLERVAGAVRESISEQPVSTG